MSADVELPVWDVDIMRLSRQGTMEPELHPWRNSHVDRLTQPSALSRQPSRMRGAVSVFGTAGKVVA